MIQGSIGKLGDCPEQQAAEQQDYDHRYDQGHATALQARTPALLPAPDRHPRFTTVTFWKLSVSSTVHVARLRPRRRSRYVGRSLRRRPRPRDRQVPASTTTKGDGDGGAGKAEWAPELALAAQRLPKASAVQAQAKAPKCSRRCTPSRTTRSTERDDFSYECGPLQRDLPEAGRRPPARRNVGETMMLPPSPQSPQLLRTTWLSALIADEIRARGRRRRDRCSLAFRRARCPLSTLRMPYRRSCRSAHRKPFACAAFTSARRCVPVDVIWYAPTTMVSPSASSCSRSGSAFTVATSQSLKRVTPSSLASAPMGRIPKLASELITEFVSVPTSPSGPDAGSPRSTQRASV